MPDLFVSFLWHHHQPSYREEPGGRYAMPWVRLHGIKGYYGMAWLTAQHREAHVTFNLVPCLLEQLEDYARGTAREKHLELTAKPAEELSESEVRFILDEFFSANWETTVRRHGRYGELLRQRHFGARSAKEVAASFSPQDLRDLQVWSTLAWFFPPLLQQDAVLRELAGKGRGFTEQDKAAMLERQQDVLARVIGMYRELQDQGSAELSVSPFFHPILPLLCDMSRAREAMPSLPLPSNASDLTEDARTQVRRAVESYEQYFGRPPRGMWPSEGSVSPEVVTLAAEAGFQWLATDEGILSRSLDQRLERDAQGKLKKPDRLYQPYRASANGSSVAVLFRDRPLADLIGFQYYHRPGREAAADLLRRLKDIGSTASKGALVSIILDGENAWEHYRDGGVSFLRALYRGLVETDGLHPVTVSEYLEDHPPKQTLPRLFSGSWINSDFGVWIGHEEDRTAWEALGEAREFLVEQTQDAAPSEAAEQAWDELYAAEGSDWFWWYGDDRSSGKDSEFDRLFRRHLQNIYRLLGEKPPDSLEEPIARSAGAPPWSVPRGFMQLEPDGRPTDFFEWLPAGLYDRERDRGVMEGQADERIRRVYFGFSAQEFYLRVDTQRDWTADIPQEACLAVVFTEPRGIVLDILDPTAKQPQVRLQGQPCAEARAAAGKVLEVGCPFQALGFQPRAQVRFALRLLVGEEVLEGAPRAGDIHFEVPTADFEDEQWQV